jgi:putative cell wall-binding protein
MRRGALIAAVLMAVALVPTAGPAGAQEDSACPSVEALDLPNAEFFQAVCLEDLNTAGNDRTDRNNVTGSGSRSSGALHSNQTDLPEDTVPGLQIEGHFPDSCDHFQPESTDSIRFYPPCDNGLRHNSQFVIRIPNDWDGVHLLVAGTPGVRTHWASDIILSDWVLSKGWAYASQDKGNTGLNFFRAGDTETGGSRTEWIPGKSIEQWAPMMGLAAEAAQAAIAQTHGKAPDLTYAAGISNGGHQTRLALEHFPDLYDGGIDWEGTLLIPEGPNLFTYLPPILRNYPAARLGDRDAYLAMVHEGRLPPHSEPVWDNHWSIYWGLVQSTYRPVFDPEYTSYVASPRTVPPGDPDAEYEYFERPDFVAERIAEVANTGDINGKPLITLHGTLDALLPIDTDSDVYADMVREQGHGEDFRYYVVEGGTHVDTAADSYPDVFRPILPCFWDSIEALDAWVTEGTEPPPSGFIPFPSEQTPAERANTCALPQPVDRVAGENRFETAVAASRGSRVIAETVVTAAAGAFPDALAAVPLAHRLDAPLLLVGDEVPEVVLADIERLGAFEAVVVGGTDAVPEAVDEQLAREDVEVRRVAGEDRYATAAAVAAELGAEAGEAIVASGERFPDALAAGPLAGGSDAPILLTRRDQLPAATSAALADLGMQRTTVVGGPAAVSGAVEGQLPSATRVAGADRYATAAAVAAEGVRRGLDLEQVGVATGADFPDALAAGPALLAGYGGAPGLGPLLLVDGRRSDGGAAAAEFLRQHQDAVRQALVFGGPTAVTDTVANRLETVLLR